MPPTRLPMPNSTAGDVMRTLFGSLARKTSIALASAALGLLIVGAMAPAVAQTDDSKVCAGKDPKEAIAACTRVLDRKNVSKTDRERALGYRGSAYGKLGEYSRAITDLSASIALNPNNKWTRNERAFSYNALRQHDSAIADLDAALKIDPKYAVAYNNRGFAYRGKGDNDRAINDYDQAIKLDPKYTICYNNRGVAYQSKGDIDRAIRDFDEALRLDSKYALAYANRGYAYYKKGDNDRAIDDFDQAIKINPDYQTAHLSRARAYFAKKDYRSSISDLDVLIRLNPRNTTALNLRGAAYRNIDDFDRAIADLSEAIRINSRHATAYANRGFTYRRMNDFNSAISDYTAAIRIDPKFAVAYYHRAIAHKLKGEVSQAYQDIVQAIALDSGYDAAIKERNTLRSMLASTTTGQQQTNPPPPVVTPPVVKPPVIAQRGPKVALVIGNGRYVNAPELPNPPNDARALAAALRGLGFKVIEGFDLDGTEMREKIGEFSIAMEGASTTLLFYAGHGMQVAGRNYLIPIDARLERPSSLGIEAIAVNTILSDMESEKRTNLVFLDACRDNPLSRSLARSFGASRSTEIGQGLALVSAGIGTLITFATSPGDVALDGSGNHSPFTAALLKYIGTPRLEVRSMLTRVRVDVMKATNERQVPWDHSALTGEFYFNPGG